MPTPNFREPREPAANNPPPLASPAQVERYKHMLPREHQAKLRKIVAAEVEKRGLRGASEEDEAWGIVEAEVIANLIINDTDPDEVFAD